MTFIYKLYTLTRCLSQKLDVHTRSMEDELGYVPNKVYVSLFNSLFTQKHKEYDIVVIGTRAKYLGLQNDLRTFKVCCCSSCLDRQWNVFTTSKLDYRRKT